MVTRLIILLISLWGGFSLAQSDSVLIPENENCKDGIYLTPTDFRKNNAIEKELIITPINKEQIDFYYKVTLEDKINFTYASTTFTLETKKIWGLVQNKTLFVNYKGNFYRVPVFGAICYFVGVIEVTGYYNGIYDPMYGMGTGRAVKTKELHEFMMSFYNGKIFSFDIDYLDFLLQSDEEVYKQFKSLSKNKRKKQAIRFIRMYNEKHPIYYLK